MLMAYRDMQERNAKHETEFRDLLLPKPVPHSTKKLTTKFLVIIAYNLATVAL
jgi:hypothetical protein